jgi:hypothetical protein
MILLSLLQQPGERPSRTRIRSDRLWRDEVPIVRAKGPGRVRQAAERFVGPGRLAIGCEDHQPLRCFHSDASHNQRLLVPPQQGDRLIEPGSGKERLPLAQLSDARAVISPSRTARSPPAEDLMRYENSPVWSAGISRVTS